MQHRKHPILGTFRQLWRTKNEQKGHFRATFEWRRLRTGNGLLVIIIAYILLRLSTCAPAPRQPVPGTGGQQQGIVDDNR